jgi:ligand-binding sensor domain-containing protein/signal transduction histidine kinase
VKTPLYFPFLLLLFVGEIRAQSFRFDHFAIKDGLSQSQAFSIFQDSYGYIWFGTQDGLNRFDGNTFLVSKNNPFDSTTLTHNWVWSVQEDDHADIWVGTYQGLCKYVRSQNKFIQYHHRPGDSTSVIGNRTNYIIKDKKGRLWISCWGSGLSLYDEQTNSFRSFKNNPHDSTSLSDNYIRTMFCDAHGNIWVGTWNGGLNKIVEETNGFKFERYNGTGYAHPAVNRITSITEDKKGILWICSHEAGLIVFNPSSKIFSQVKGPVKKDVNKVIIDVHNNVWIATSSGLYHYDYASGEYTRLQHDPSNPTSISGNSIFSLLEDNDGLVWVGGNGIDIYDPRKMAFATYQNRKGDHTSLSENLIWSFCEDEEQNIWIGTEAQQVDVFNPKTKSFRHVSIRDAKGNVATHIYNMVYDDGVFWLASNKSGLIRYEKKTGKAYFFLEDHRSILGKVSLVNEVFLNEDKTLWIATYEHGLIHFDPRTEKATQYLHERNNPSSIGVNSVKSLHKDNRGNLWVTYNGAGLGKLDRITNKFTNYEYDRKNADGLSDQLVGSIEQQNDSIFWLCTHAGLNRLNVNTGKFTHFFEKDGLANNTIYEMLKDKGGNYWISSNGGISKFNPDTYTFKNYTKDAGLQSNEFNSNAALKSSTGEFYFGGVNGFNVFRPEDVKEDTTAPPLLIQGYSIFDESFLPDDNLDLQYFQNYISFSFSALEFSSPQKVKYTYKLEGFDDDWISPTNERQAHYTNLDPGKYTFHVKAANPDGYWTEPGASMSLIIRPPFWKTWWFITLAVAATGSLIYLVHRYQLEQSLKVERLRNKIASDLHDEVGSSLSRISIYSDLLQNDKETPERKNYLTGIGELSREVVSTMSDIVWSIDNRHDTLGSLVIRMKDFATEILQVRNIELEFSTQGIDEQTILDPALKQNIYLIFKESIHNIVKHARAGNVSVKLVNEKGEFKMIIKDDGCGFTQNGKQNGNGLRNMKRRARTVGGEFEIQNRDGTVLILRRKAL